MTRKSTRGFARTDLAALLAIGVIGAALALAAGRQMRQQATLASSLSQLRWMAGATTSYAADNDDLFWSFSWKAGALPHADPTLPSAASSDLIAGAVQATDILRRLTGRPDIPVPAGWIPQVLYSHLPLTEYLGAALPEFNFVAPGDAHRLNWARNPEAFDRGEFLPYQPEPGDDAKRWPYSSSYTPPAAWWDRNHGISQASTHRTYIIAGGAQLGGAAMSNVAYPAQKVMVHDDEQRELGGVARYCLDPAARVPMLMADGSAGVRATADANPGGHPTFPTIAATMRFLYDPSAWEAPSGVPENAWIIGRYRWTRGNIYGRDFGGPEIYTGQP